MAYSLIAHTSAQSADGSNVVTSAIDTSGATILVVAVSSFLPGGAVTITDSKGNTWTSLTAHSQTNNRLCLHYAKNPTVGSGHTFTGAASSTFPGLAVQAWSGAHTTAPADQENGAATPTASALATGSVTPSQDNELVVSGASFSSMTNTLAIDNGFTVSDQAPLVSGQAMGIAFAYKVQTTAAAVNPAWSWSGNDEAAVAIATFKVSAVAVTNAGRMALLGVGQ